MGKLPSLKAIQAFEATARHLSFSRAADELHVSQSAVSHQIRSLESFFGKQLFIRRSNQVSLTTDGDILFSVVKDSFKRIQTVTDHLLEQKRFKLEVVVQSSVAVDWLAPRIALFNQKQPDIDVKLSLAVSDTQFDSSDYDVIIGTWPAPTDFDTQKIRDESWYPVCTPSFYEKIDVKDPYSIIQSTVFSSENGQDWQLWMQNQNIDTSIKLEMQHVNTTILAAKAAQSGLGVALSCDFIVEDAVKQGTLVAIKSLSYELPWGHFSIHYRSGSHLLEKVKVFVDWFIDISNQGQN